MADPDWPGVSYSSIREHSSGDGPGCHAGVPRASLSGTGPCAVRCSPPSPVLRSPSRLDRVP